jgi:hypothetical protein
MNTRIQELAQQAACDTRKDHNNPYWRMQDEIPEDATWRKKFAELIIRECADLVPNIWSANPLVVSTRIKERFGVEE